MKDKNLKVTLSGKDITRLEAIGQLAEAVNADILINPGKVTLVPRVKGEGADGKRP